MDDEVQKAKAQKKSNALFVLACTRGYLADVKALLEQGADPEATDKRKVNALHFACGQGRLEVVSFLWSRGIELDAEDPSGNLPLHYAVIGGKAAVVAFLLSKGAWVEGSNSLDDTALHIAARKGQEDVVRMLLEHGGRAVLKDVNKRGLTALGEALAAGHVAIADQLVKAGADVEVKTRGWSLLHLMASLGKSAPVKFLLDSGAQLTDTGNEEGMTALHCAAAAGQLEAAKLLSKSGADPAIADLQGRQPHVLAPDTNKELKKLLQTKAPPKTPIVSTKTVGRIPTNDVEDFKALDSAARIARVDKWAAMEDPKQLDRALLEFPLELRTQLLELQRLHQILNIQQAIMELLDDDDFQQLAQNPMAAQIVEQVHSNPEAYRRYAEDKTIMHLLRSLQRFQAVVRANGGHQVPFQSLLKTSESDYYKKSGMRLKGMRLMLDARRRAAVAAALAGSEAEAKANAAKEMDPKRQRSPAAATPPTQPPSAAGLQTAAPAASTEPAPSPSASSPAPKPAPRKKGSQMGNPVSQSEVLPADAGTGPSGSTAARRQPLSWKLLWREMLRAAQQTLVIFAVFVAVLYATGNKMPWDARAPAERRPVSKLRLEDEY